MTEANAVWYVPGDDDQPAGPFTAAQVLDSWKGGQLTETTLCWREGMAEWQALATVQPFASAIQQARVVARRRRRRIGVFVGGALVVIAAVATAYVLMTDPQRVQQGQRLVDAGVYDTAIQTLEQFLAERPDHPKANYLLALAKVNDYASRGRHRAGGRIRMKTGDDPLQSARKLFQTTFSLNANWMEKARTDLARSSTLVPKEAADAVSRTLAIARLRVDLQVGDPKKLARDLLDIAATHPESRTARTLGDEVALQLLDWDTSLAGQIVELALPSEKVPRTELSQRISRLRRWAAERPQLADVLPAALLRRSDALIVAGEHETAEVLLKTAGQIRPDLLPEIARRRLAYLTRLLDVGEGKYVRDLLNRAKNESPEMQAGAVQLYLRIAIAHRKTDPALAKEALNGALKLDPDVERGEEISLMLIEFADKPDKDKLHRCQRFAQESPESAHVPEVLMILVADATAEFGKRARDLADLYLAEGEAAAYELMQRFPQTPELDSRVFALAERFGAKGKKQAKAFGRARELAEKLLEVVPDTPKRLEIERAIMNWRRDEGCGTLPREFYQLADRVEKELKQRKITLVEPGTIPHLAEDPDAVDIVEIAPSCTANNFNSEQAEILRRWVADGGVLWVNNDVLSLFNITYKRLGARNHDVTQPGVTPEMEPILTGCKSVYVKWARRSAYNLSADQVTPLLNTPKKATIWSLVPYGNGWVSDVKEVDVAQYDGARFWLNFRCFCLDLPDCEVLWKDREPPPPPPPTPVPPPPPPKDLTVVTTVAELEAAVAQIDLQRVIWVRLPKKNVNEGPREKLQDWVRSGGVLWVETDMAGYFGLGRALDQPASYLRKGWAEVLTGAHPIVAGVGGAVPYELALDQPVIRFEEKKGIKGLTPLLGWRDRDDLMVICGIRVQGEGLVIYRPSQIDTENERGRRFEENLRSFSLEAARTALSRSATDGDGGETE